MRSCDFFTDKKSWKVKMKIERIIVCIFLIYRANISQPLGIHSQKNIPNNSIIFIQYTVQYTVYNQK